MRREHHAVAGQFMLKMAYERGCRDNYPQICAACSQLVFELAENQRGLTAAGSASDQFHWDGSTCGVATTSAYVYKCKCSLVAAFML